MSTSPAPLVPSGSSSGPANRHAPTPVERQRGQLEKLLKDPSKPAFVPLAPKEKSIRAAREMMKNVQGSSAGAGSGEFHVYKASRRREYERLKLMDEKAQKEAEVTEFERKKREREEQAEAKTAKNREKRQKKKGRTKGKETEGGAGTGEAHADVPLKKRRLVNGKELLFKRPGEDSDSDDDDEVGRTPADAAETVDSGGATDLSSVPVVDAPRIIIHEDD